MIKKIFRDYKYLVIFFAAIMVFVPLSHVLALEVTYPTIPGFPNVNTNPTLPNYIDYFFGVAILSAGILGFFSIVYAGVKLLTAAGNPSAISDARERILGSILGIALLMFSFILLNAINPQLVNVKTLPLVLNPDTGVYFVRTAPQAHNPFGIQSAYADNLNGNFEFIPAPETDFDTANIPAGFDKIVYFCSLPGPDLRFYQYNKKDLGLDNSADVKIIPCRYSFDDITSESQMSEIALPLNNVKSFKTAKEQPGVYLYLKDGCDNPSDGTGINVSTEAITESGAIPTEFQNPKSAFILNGDGVDDPKLGFILNRAPDGSGKCSKPVVNFTSEYIDGPYDKGLCVSTFDSDS